MTVAVAAVALTVGGGAAAVVAHRLGTLAEARAPVVPIADGLGAPPAAPAVPAKGPGWFAKFDAVYGLEKGQVVKRVPPPFIAERWNFWKSQQPGIRPLKPGEQMIEKSFVIERDPSGYHWKMASVGESNLGEAMKWVGGVKNREVDGPDAMKGIELPGDWVYLKGARPAEKMAALEALVRKETGRKVTIRPATKMMDAVIVRGTPSPTGPADDLGRHLVELGLGEAVETAPGAPSVYPREPRPTSMKGVFVELETWFAVPVIDEVGLDAYGVVMKAVDGGYEGQAQRGMDEHDAGVADETDGVGVRGGEARAGRLGGNGGEVVFERRAKPQAGRKVNLKQSR
jgi:hypothetical protein